MTTTKTMMMTMTRLILMCCLLTSLIAAVDAVNHKSQLLGRLLSDHPRRVSRGSPHRMTPNVCIFIRRKHALFSSELSLYSPLQKFRKYECVSVRITLNTWFYFEGISLHFALITHRYNITPSNCPKNLGHYRFY